MWNWKECKRGPRNVEESVDIDDVEMEYAHRAGRKNRNPRRTVSKLLQFKDKRKYFEKSKASKKIAAKIL